MLVLGFSAGCDGLWAAIGGGRGDGKPLPVSHTIGEVGSSPGQFLYPRALAADGRGWAAAGETEGPHLWVIDKAGRIQRLNAATGRATIAFRAPDIALGRPCGVTLGPTWRGGPGDQGGGGARSPDLLYVADTHYHRILIYAPPSEGEKEPRLVGQFGSYGRGPGEFIYVTDVAILTDDEGYAVRFYVGEYGGNDRVSLWEPSQDGVIRFVSAFGVQGDGRESSREGGAIEFDRPQSLAIDRAADAGRGRLVLTDSCNHRVGVFTLSGNLVRWIDGRAGGVPAAVEPGATAEDAMFPEAGPDGTSEGGSGDPGPGRGGMAYPFGLHLLDDGTALVTEYGNHRLRHMDLETGKVLGLYGVGGRGPGELLNPWAVTMIGRTVYVLDSGNERIQAFTLPRTAWRTATGVGSP
jgi:hypothetical protein